MSPETHILLSGALSFGVPLALAVRELILLRRPAPGGGRDRRPEPAPAPAPQRPLPDCLIPRPAPRRVPEPA